MGSGGGKKQGEFRNLVLNKVEILIRDPGGDVEWAVGHSSLECVREVRTRNVHLGVSVWMVCKVQNFYLEFHGPPQYGSLSHF